jgi:hypothetical protein
MGGYIATEGVARKENRQFWPVAPESQVTALPGLKTSPQNARTGGRASGSANSGLGVLKYPSLRYPSLGSS